MLTADLTAIGGSTDLVPVAGIALLVLSGAGIIAWVVWLVGDLVREKYWAHRDFTRVAHEYEWAEHDRFSLQEHQDLDWRWKDG